MEERVSGGAIIQHLAKLRQRCAAAGINVPPPLRRGGGNGNSNSRGRNTGLGTPAAPMQAAPTPAAPTPAASRRTRASANISLENRVSEREEEDIDVDGASESEEEFGSQHAGQSTPKSKGREPKVEEADEDEIEQEDGDTASNAGKKRKRSGDSNGPPKRKRGPAKRKNRKRKNSKGDQRAPSSVSSSDENGSSDDESQISDDGGYQQDSVGRRYFAVGADFFEDYDEDEAPNLRESDSKGTKAAQLVAVLRLGESERAKGFLHDLQDQEKAAHETNAETFAYSRTTSVTGFNGGRENIVYGDEASSNVADVDYYPSTSGNPPQLSQGYAQRLPRVPLSFESGSLVSNNNYGSVELGDHSFLGGRNATYDPPAFHHPNLNTSDHWDLRSVPADLVSTNFAAPVGYSAHMSQQVNVGDFGSSNLNFPTNYANNFGQGSGSCPPLVFDHGSAITLSQGFVAPADLSGTGPGPYGNPFSQTQGSSSGYTQQVQGSAVISSASSAEISHGAFSDPFLTENSSAVQVPRFENSEDVNWTDFLLDFDGSEYVPDTTFMTNISGQSNGGTGAEE